MERYRIDSRLSPSSPNVFRVTRVADGTPFILKRVSLSIDGSANRQAYLEAQLASRLHHPHIVKCEEVFMFGDSDLCLVFALHSQGDMAGLINRAIAKREQLLPEDVVMKYFISVALALHFLHSHRIVHRDVKTSNIFLEGNQGTGGAVLGDFGIAQVLNSGGRVDADEDAAASGTPQYMAPELLQGGNQHSFKSDVWALGCVLYELLCFRHPFEARDVSSLVVKVIQGNFRPVPQRYSRELCELLVRLLDVNPAGRPDIDEVLEMPYVVAHLKRHYATVVARGMLNPGAMAPVEKRNFLTQMQAFRIISSHAAQNAFDDEGSPHAKRHSPTKSVGTGASNASQHLGASLHSAASAQLSPYRLQAGRLAPGQFRSPSMPSPNTESRRTSSVATSSAHQAPQHGRRAIAPAEVANIRAPPAYRDEREAALYLACREHDDAVLHLRDAVRRNVTGSVSTTTSVKDTIDRVLYGPPPARVERRVHRDEDSVASFM